MSTAERKKEHKIANLCYIPLKALRCEHADSRRKKFVSKLLG